MFKKILATTLALCAASVFAAVDVNDASVADLDSIKGVGPSTSTKIVEQRNVAKFKDWSDFKKRVPGIGEKRAAKLSAEGLTVQGQPYKEAAKAEGKAPAKTGKAVKEEKPAAEEKKAVKP